MMKQIKAMNLALEALEYIRNFETDVASQTKYGRAQQIIEEILAEQPAPVQQEPVGCEGAIVNGRVYADRLEHDYKFECEAGPLHLCTDWVEFRRCFEWLAQHTSPPAQQEPVAWQYRDARDDGTWGAWLGCDKRLAEDEYRQVRALYASPQTAHQEPVAVVSGYYGGQCVILPIDPARIFNSNTALYTSPPAQRKPLTLWTEAQHERAYRNSPDLHKDVKSLAAFKRVAKEIAAMYGIKENT